MNDPETSFIFHNNLQITNNQNFIKMFKALINCRIEKSTVLKYGINGFLSLLLIPY